MGNRVVIFPASKEAQARAYAAWTDEHNPWTMPTPANNTGSWAYVRPDINGDWVVPYLGPPWQFNYVAYEEPEGGPAMRTDGVIHDFAVWPEED